MKKILKFCGIVLVVGIGVLLFYSRVICHNTELELVELNKENKELLVLDKCSNCGSVFLDGGEIEKIEEALNKKTTYQQSDFLTGFVVGSFF